MFRFNDKREQEYQRGKKLYDNLEKMERPKFKELVIMVYKQYLIIIPTIFIVFLVIMLILKGILALWGA